MSHCTQGYWFTLHKCVTRGRKGRSPVLFFEIRKKCLGYGKEGPDCVHPEIKFFIQNVVLRVPRKKFQNVSLQGLFLVFLMKCLCKCPSSTKTLLPWNISGCAPALRRYSICKTLHLKCLTVFWIRFCLNNCSVISTVTLCRPVFLQL